jgi:CheY-like chemotaxis protein
VVSADATPGRIQQVMAAGARHYLTKPVALSAFLALLDGMMEAVDTRLD